MYNASKQERDREDHLNIIEHWFGHFLTTLLIDIDPIRMAQIPKECS